MKLTKKNQKLIEGWERYDIVKLSDNPSYIAHVFLRDGLFKVLVVREPFNPRSSEAFTPVVFESGPHKSFEAALQIAKAACT